MRKSFLLTALAALVLLGGCGLQQTDASDSGISVAGSTALQPLVQAGAKAYTKAHPAVSITVVGGGSATGLSAVAGKRVTVGMADMFAEQATEAPARLVDHLLAVVPIAVIVNRRAGVTALTRAQLAAVYTGKLTNWHQVGGADLPIRLLTRESGSGTRAAFEQLALADAQGLRGSVESGAQAMARAVTTTPGAIGYVPLNRVTAAANVVALDGVTPSAETVADNRWPLWAYEHLYTNGSPDAITARFIHFLQTDTTRIKAAGYVPLAQMQVARTHDGQLEDTH